LNVIDNGNNYFSEIVDSNGFSENFYNNECYKFTNAPDTMTTENHSFGSSEDDNEHPNGPMNQYQQFQDYENRQQQQYQLNRQLNQRYEVLDEIHIRYSHSSECDPISNQANHSYDLGLSNGPENFELHNLCNTNEMPFQIKKDIDNSVNTLDYPDKIINSNKMLENRQKPKLEIILYSITLFFLFGISTPIGEYDDMPTQFELLDNDFAIFFKYYNTLCKLFGKPTVKNFKNLQIALDGIAKLKTKIARKTLTLVKKVYKQAQVHFLVQKDEYDLSQQHVSWIIR